MNISRTPQYRQSPTQGYQNPTYFSTASPPPFLQAPLHVQQQVQFPALNPIHVAVRQPDLASPIHTPRSPGGSNQDIESSASALRRHIRHESKRSETFHQLKNAISNQEKTDSLVSRKLVNGKLRKDKSELKKMVDLMIQTNQDNFKTDNDFFQHFCRCIGLLERLSAQLSSPHSNEWPADVECCQNLAYQMKASLEHLIAHKYLAEIIGSLTSLVDAVISSCQQALDAHEINSQPADIDRLLPPQPDSIRAYRAAIKARLEHEADCRESDTHLSRLFIAARELNNKSPLYCNIYKNDNINDIKNLANLELNKNHDIRDPLEIIENYAACGRLEYHLGVNLLSNHPQQALDELHLYRKLVLKQRAALETLIDNDCKVARPRKSKAKVDKIDFQKVKAGLILIDERVAKLDDMIDRLQKDILRGPQDLSPRADRLLSEKSGVGSQHQFSPSHSISPPSDSTSAPSPRRSGGMPRRLSPDRTRASTISKLQRLIEELKVNTIIVIPSQETSPTPSRPGDDFFSTKTSRFVERYARNTTPIHAHANDYDAKTSSKYLRDDFNAHMKAAIGLLNEIPSDPLKAIDYLRVAHSLVKVSAAAYQELNRREQIKGGPGVKHIDLMMNEMEDAIQLLESAQH